MSIAALLSLIASAGANLPAIIALVQGIIALVQQFQASTAGQPVKLSVHPLSDEEQDLIEYIEGKLSDPAMAPHLAALHASHPLKAAGGREVIGGIATFFKNHPNLIPLAESLIKSLLA